MSYLHDKRRHDELSLVDLRAHATSVGLVQLCIELRHADLLDEGALDRIKEAIAGDLVLSAPQAGDVTFRSRIKRRLDNIFSGQDGSSQDATGGGG